MDVYEVQEKVQIIKWLYSGSSLRATRDLFAVTFENRPIPCINTIHRILRNFEEHGCLSPANHKRTPPPRNVNQEMQEVRICAAVEEDPRQSSRNIAQDTGVHHNTVLKVKKKWISFL